MKKFAVLIVVTSFIAAGCEKEKDVKTVEWFKEHEKERREMLAKCNDNPGELIATPNCFNANRAESSMTWSSRSGMRPVKPLTSEEINKK
ncbi:MAG TPA: EexN family lipoprotein [Oligoflexus sp.]|uniref:EexN family lipoprotein n=1 Tax=Oligoflexus sp. TaxID=1971216 RepID=UPI002D807AC9|nr:EexN family lipoprotein [Oligoflexus sp.]HET9239204.1 EexN family lipoprotein [Oligoflexus sp.]